MWQLHYYGYDGLGSVRVLFDAAGSTAEEKYAYDANGQMLWHWSAGTTIPNNYLFAGEQWDTDLGMYYNRARYYRPDAGRFWTMDSYEGSPSDPLSLHKYLYAHADPVNGIDPSGRMSISTVYYSVGARFFMLASRLAAFPRFMALGRATATALTVGSLVVSDEARATFLCTGNPAAAVSGLADDVGFLIYRGGTLLQRSASALARTGVLSTLEVPLGAAARQIRNIASDAVIGFRGSVASGVKFSTQGPFDPTDFDLDAFIVSDNLAARIAGREFRNGRDVSEIAAEANKIEELLINSFPGYRTQPGKPFTFRVWTTEEFEQVVKQGPYVSI